MSFLMPKAPSTGPMPTETSPRVQTNKAAMLGRFKRSRAGGTIATSSLGVTEPAPTKKKSLGGTVA